MKHRLGTIVIAASLTGLSASIAGASINITNAHLVNTYTTNTIPTSTSTVVFDSASPGDSFTNRDVNGVGFTASIDPATGGFFRVEDNGTSNVTYDGAYTAGTSGTLAFTADAPFTLSLGTAPQNNADSSAYAGGDITVTNDATGQSLKLNLTFFGPTLTGTLPAIDAPAGNYSVEFNLSPHRLTGITFPRAIQLDLATTPEPATLATLVIPSLLLRRRRRRR